MTDKTKEKDPSIKDLISAIKWEIEWPTPKDYDQMGTFTKFLGIVKRWDREKNKPYYIVDEISLMKDQHYGGGEFTHFLHEGDYVEVIAWIQLGQTIDLDDILKLQKIHKALTGSDNNKQSLNTLNLNLSDQLI